MGHVQDMKDQRWQEVASLEQRLDFLRPVSRHIYIQNLLEKYPTPSSANPCNSIRPPFYGCFLKRGLYAESTGSNIPEKWCDKILEHLFFFKHSKSNTNLTLKKITIIVYSITGNCRMKTAVVHCALWHSLIMDGCKIIFPQDACLIQCTEQILAGDEPGLCSWRMMLWASVDQEGPDQLYTSDKPDINIHVKS